MRAILLALALLGCSSESANADKPLPTCPEGLICWPGTAEVITCQDDGPACADAGGMCASGCMGGQCHPPLDAAIACELDAGGD